MGLLASITFASALLPLLCVLAIGGMLFFMTRGSGGKRRQEHEQAGSGSQLPGLSAVEVPREEQHSIDEPETDISAARQAA